MANTVMTPIGVLNFPALFTAQRNKANPAQDPRFSGMLIFDDTALQTSAYAELKAAIMAAAVEKFSEAKMKDAAFVQTLNFPVRDTAGKTWGGASLGSKFISAWQGLTNKATGGENPPPGVIDLQGNKIIVPSDVFSGQLARFTVRPFAYDSNGNKGVSLGLEHVQIVKADAERLDGRPTAEQAFANGSDDQLAALGIDPNASAGSSVYDQEIPF